MAFHRGIFVLYLLQRGMSQAQVGLLETSLFWSIFILEIPTGMLGDKVGRKWSNFISLVVLCISTAGMAFSHNFTLFFLFFVLEGCSAAFRSGSDAAFLYDSLKMLKREGEYLVIYARIKAMSSVVLGIAMAVGGLLQNYGWEAVYLSYAVAVFLSSLCILFTHEKMSDLAEIEDGNPAATHGHIVQEIKGFFGMGSSKALAFFIAIVCLNEGIIIPYFTLGQSMFQEFGFSEELIGIIYSVIEIAAGLIYLAAKRVSDRYSLYRILVVMMIFYSLFMIVNVFENAWISTIAFLISMVVPDVVDIIINNYIQERIPSKIRASILSAMSMLTSALIGLGYMGYGFLFDTIGVLKTFTLAAVMPMSCLVLFIIYFETQKKRASRI